MGSGSVGKADSRGRVSRYSFPWVEPRLEIGHKVDVFSSPLGDEAFGGRVDVWRIGESGQGLMINAIEITAIYNS